MYRRIRNSAAVERISDGAFIPPDEANADHQRFLAWQKEGNTPATAEPQPTLTQEQLDAQAAKAHAKVAALRSMKPAEAAAWVDVNVTNLAEAKDLLKTIAVVLSVLARRL